MAEIIWSKLAFDQLERNIVFIKQDRGDYYAKLVLHKIFKSTDLLEKYPKAGKIEPLLAFKKAEYRFLVVWSLK
jgi:toxin ParE1/3/4